MSFDRVCWKRLQFLIVSRSEDWIAVYYLSFQTRFLPSSPKLYGVCCSILSHVSYLQCWLCWIDMHCGICRLIKLIYNCFINLLTIISFSYENLSYFWTLKCILLINKIARKSLTLFIFFVILLFLFFFPSSDANIAAIGKFGSSAVKRNCRHCGMYNPYSWKRILSFKCLRNTIKMQCLRVSKRKQVNAFYRRVWWTPLGTRYVPKYSQPCSCSKVVLGQLQIMWPVNQVLLNAYCLNASSG